MTELLRVRTRLVVLLVDEVTGRPPAGTPRLRLLRLDPDRTVDVDASATRTPGGAIVFDELERPYLGVGSVTYRVVVDPDATLRPAVPGGHVVTLGGSPDRGPVRLTVPLLPGPAYPYLPSTPVVRGVVTGSSADPAARLPVPDALVVVSPDEGFTVVGRARTDQHGGFGLGLPRGLGVRAPASPPLALRAQGPLGVTGRWRPLRPADLHRSVSLTIRR